MLLQAPAAAAFHVFQSSATVHPVPKEAQMRRQPPPPGCMVSAPPVMSNAPIPCGFTSERPVLPVPHQPAYAPDLSTVPVVNENRLGNSMNYDGNSSAPHPYVYWLAKRTVTVAAGDNVEVTKDLDVQSGDTTYTVSSRIPPEEKKRIDELERELERQLAEVKRIKANMLMVSEEEDTDGSTDDGGAIVFTKGFEQEEEG